MGPLVDRQIFHLTEGPEPSLKIGNQHIQPVSVDLPIGSLIHQVSAEPNLHCRFRIERFLTDYSLNRIDLRRQAQGFFTLTPRSTFVIELDVRLDLPSGVSIKTSPKSSTGRNAIHSKVIASNGVEFDIIPAGYRGKIYAVVTPRVFPIQVKAGETLVQARLFAGNRVFLQDWELEHFHRQQPLIGNEGYKPIFTSEGLLLHLNLGGKPSNLVANPLGKPIPLWARDLDPTSHFREKQLDHNENLFLEPREFALAETIEQVRIPPLFCAEMSVSDPRHGEIRWHDAGFFDPGFGFGETGELNGASIVCEITNYGDATAMLSHGQQIGSLRFERLSGQPENVYGSTKIGSHYQGQVAIRMAKQFAPWPTRCRQCHGEPVLVERVTGGDS